MGPIEWAEGKAADPKTGVRATGLRRRVCTGLGLVVVVGGVVL